jgi:hypothetical protein
VFELAGLGPAQLLLGLQAAHGLLGQLDAVALLQLLGQVLNLL